MEVKNEITNATFAEWMGEVSPKLAYDTDGTIVSYDWDYGDGSPHGSGATASHTYADGGV